MKKIVWAGFVCFVLLVSAQQSYAACAKIKDGTITDSGGTPIQLGYDQFGYNYQAHMFNGTYDSSDRVLDGLYWGAAVDYADDSLIMKWSDEWISNLDCNGDNKLDRGLNAKTGESTGVSMGWLTNHVEGDYIADLDSRHYTYSVKFVYDGGGACSTGSPTCIWGVYAIIESVYNDPYGGYHGIEKNMHAKPSGLGFYTND
jgi:hypothetical protein